MSQLIQIKQRIISIKKTSKITHAMRLMSMSLYAKLEKQSVSISRYKSRITNLFEGILPYVSGWKSPLFFPEDILDTQPLFILVMSSKGLCGSFNSNLIRFFERTFVLEKNQKPSFITVGEKARKFLEKKSFASVIAHYPELSTQKLVETSEQIVSQLTTGEHHFSSVTILSNHLKNFFIQIPEKTVILPFIDKNFSQNQEKQEKEPEEKNLDQHSLSTQFSEEPLWEQDKKELLNAIALRYLKSLILNKLLDSLLAEQASRFIAMDNSTTNAEKYLEKLTLQFNKSRQAIITREVAELSAGFAQNEKY